MATIQDLLRAKGSKPLQDLLSKYQSSMNSPVQENVDAQTAGAQNFADGGTVEDEIQNLIEQNQSKEPDLYKQLTKKVHQPEIVEEPIFNAKSTNPIETPVDAEIIEPTQPSDPKMMFGGIASGVGNAMGFNTGIAAYEEAKKDPNSQISKLNAMIDRKGQPEVKDGTVPGGMLNRPSFVKGALGEGPFAKAEDYEPTVSKDEEMDDSDYGETNQAAREKMLGQLGKSGQEESETPTAEQPKNPLQELLNAYKGTQDTHTRDLASAQDKANQNEFYANLMRGMNQLNSGITGTAVTGPAAVHNEGLDAIQKAAQTPIKQYEQNVENEKNDPNSEYSKGLNLFLAPMFEKLGIKNPGPLSGATAEKIAPFGVKMYDQQLSKEANDQKAKANDIYKKSAMSDRNRRIDSTIEGKANAEFDRNTDGEVKRLQACKRVLELIDAVKSGQLIGSSQIRNAITADLGTLALPVGSRATMTDRQKSAINSFSTKAQELEAWINNHPNQTIPPEYITQLENETNIFKESYTNAFRTKAKSLHSSSKDQTFKDTIKNRYKEFSNEYGFEPDLEKEGQHKHSSSSKVLMIGPNGEHFKVSKDDVEDAIKHGGKLVQ